MQVSTFSNAQTEFIATTGALSSHLIINKFEEQHNLHAPEMTFFQNTLVVNHLQQNISLVFTTGDAILGSIYPPSTSFSQSTISTDVSLPTQLQDHTNISTVFQNNTAPPSTTPSTILTEYQSHYPNFPYDKFIPNPVQVKDSKKWQEHMNKNENKPDVIEETSEVGDWTYSTLYQGLFYPNTTSNQHYFMLSRDQPHDVSLAVSNTKDEKKNASTVHCDELSLHKAALNHLINNNSSDKDIYEETTRSIISLNSTTTPTSSSHIHSNSVTTTHSSLIPSPSSPFITQLSTLIPSQNLLITSSPSTHSILLSTPSSTPPSSTNFLTNNTKDTSKSNNSSSQSLIETPKSEKCDRNDQKHDQDSIEQIPDPLLPSTILPFPITTSSTSPSASTNTLTSPAPSASLTPTTTPIALPQSLWKTNFEGGINYSMLANIKEKIDFYSHIILFEDELHDNGISNYSIRIRVMGSCYYILVRNFIRVDNVVVRIRDTRYFYTFGQPFSSPSSLTLSPPQTPDYLTRETKLQEATFDELREMKRSISPKDYTEEFSSRVLPVRFLLAERIDLNTLGK